MYKLYNVKTWGSISAHLVLEEMGVPYQNIWLTPDQVRAPEFREISPLGLIPALGLDDGRVVFESAAIVSFLTAAHADKHLAPEPGTPDHGIFLAWLHFMSANIYQTLNLSFASEFYCENPAQEEAFKAKVKDQVDRLFGMFAHKLKAEGPWMLGAGFSALDIYLFMLSLWARPTEAALHERFPEIAALATAVRQRPMLKAALEAHGVHVVGGYNG